MYKNDLDGTRKCTRCKVIKPHSDFCKEKNSKIGLSYTCRKCASKLHGEYFRSHKKENREKAMRWKLANPLLHKYREIKNSAKARGLVFELDIDEVKIILNKPCHYCGSEHSRGVDRMDNTIGYLKKNCLPCCEFCNRAKFTRSYDEFKHWMQGLIHYQSTGIGTKNKVPGFYT